MSSQTVFVSADHGLALIYFLQSDVVSTLRESGNQVVVLVADPMVEKLAGRASELGVRLEGLRLDQAALYASNEAREIQWWLQFLRRVGGSRRINTAAMDSYVRQVAVEEPNRRRLLMPFGWMAIGLLRRSKLARNLVRDVQRRLAPSIYTDLFGKYQPALVVASTPGWRMDRYLLREAAGRGIQTASAIVGWDNPSSYSLPGAPVDWATCWSDVQRKELVRGSDWNPDKVNIGGIPSYDGYFRQEWAIPRDKYFAMHGLDNRKKLLSYACSFVTFSPNLPNVEALARLVHKDGLVKSTQLLVRLHPNHFLDNHLFAQEREAIRQISAETPNMKVIEPVPLGGDLGHYSGEDMSEKSSMMAHSDVFITVYSTMVVETAIHGRPIVSLCLDKPGGWNTPRKYSLPLSKIGNWPTHQRFREAKAGQVIYREVDLPSAINRYLEEPEADSEARRAFVEREVTFTDGSSGRRTGEFISGLV